MGPEWDGIVECAVAAVAIIIAAAFTTGVVMGWN